MGPRWLFSLLFSIVLCLPVSAKADWLSQIQAQPGMTNATISWVSSTPATGQVRYGTTSNYSLYSGKQVALTTSHSILLINLQPNTLYHYKVLSLDARGIQTASKDQTFVTLSSSTLGSIQVVPSAATILVGQTYQFNATGVYSDGSTRDITSQCVWSSSSTNIATVNVSGLATGMTAGGVGVTCAYSGVSDQSVLTITPIVIQHQVDLAWIANPATNVTGYNVYRTLTSGSGYLKIANVTGGASTTFTDSTVSGGKTYYYVLTALCPTCSQKTESSYSNETKAVIP